MQWYTELALLLFFTGAGFFFAMAETALLTLGKWRLRQVTTVNPARGAFIRKLQSAPQDLLATITLGNTLAHAAIIATALLISFKFDQPHFLLVALTLVAGLFLFCEVVPKTLAMRHPEAWAPRVAFLMLWIARITRPVRVVAQGINNQLIRLIPKSVKPLTPVSNDEYSELLELGWQSGTLGMSEKEIILQIMQLDRRPVADLMRPRSLMASIPHDLSVPGMLVAARKHHHRRLPMHDESSDSIVGILNATKLLANHDIDMMEVIDFPSFVPEEMNLLELLKSFQRQQHGMAIVLDEFGSTMGLVTLEDILSDVFFVNASNGWVVGENGVILRTSNGGESWERQKSNSPEKLRSVVFISENVGWVVGGEFGVNVVLQTEDSGQTWVDQSSGKLYGQDIGHFESDVWITGQNGFVKKYSK